MNYDRMSDLEIARYLVCSIPAGRWNKYGEIADAIEALSPGRELNADSRAGWRVAMTLLPLPSDAAPWHRLRNKDGVYVPPGSPPNAKERQREMDDRLRAEGCRVDMTGFAEPGNWVGGAGADPAGDGRRARAAGRGGRACPEGACSRVQEASGASA